MVTGKGFDLWGNSAVAELPLHRLMLRANRDAREAYAGMIDDRNFLAPQRRGVVDVSPFDALLLPDGNRARGMCDYLESDTRSRRPLPAC